MHRSYQWFVRLASATLAFALLVTTLLFIPPQRAEAASRPSTLFRAEAASRPSTLFRAEFDAAPVGPLAGPLNVETGQVVPQGGSVAVANTLFGRALALQGTSGQATALMQWLNYPGGLPIGGTTPISSTGGVTLTQEVHVRITADFTVALTGTAGGSFGLLNGANFFELFSFSGGDMLTRGGAQIGTYTRGLPVHLDAQITLKGATGRVRINLISPRGDVSITVALTGGFNAANLNQLRFQVPAGATLTAVDHLRVRLEDKQEDDDPPAVIIIRDGDIEQEIENINGIIFVSIKIKIVNTGGKAKGAFLVLDLDDLSELLDLADINFLEGIGFVSQLNASQVIIGLGQNNIIHHDSKLQVKIRFKVKHGGVDIKINAHFRLRFHDTGGDQELPLPPVVIIVAVIVVPGQPPTQPITPTQPMTPTDELTPTTDVTPTLILRLPITAIDVRFSAAWRGRGGLAIFGLPLSGPITLASGVVVQYFERARLEYHPDLAGTPYAVLIGRLAVELGYATPAVAAPADAGDLQWYYNATGHGIGRSFRTYWRSRGGLALFGLPIGEPVTENGLLVQYFERARMELHPELAGTPYEVQLGHLGVAVLEAASEQ